MPSPGADSLVSHLDNLTPKCIAPTACAITFQRSWGKAFSCLISVTFEAARDNGRAFSAVQRGSL